MKNQQFKETIEKALKGNIRALLDKIITERRDYDLSMSRPIMEGIKRDVATSIRVARNITTAPEDADFIMERILQEAKTEIDDWLDPDDHGANHDSFNV